MRQIINYLYLVIVVLMTGCAGCGDTKDEAQTDKEFDQIKNVADSLYSRMQFRFLSLHGADGDGTARFLMHSISKNR